MNPACSLSCVLAQFSSSDENLPWASLLLLALALAGWATALRLRLRSPASKARSDAASSDPSLSLPIHVLQLDMSGIRKDLTALQDNGLHSIASHLELQPTLLDTWRSRTHITHANAHTRTTAGAHSLEEVQAWWNKQNESPWDEVFRNLIFLLWSGLNHFEQEIIYETRRHEELTCHMRCEVPLVNGKPDTSRVLLTLTDTTLANAAKLTTNRESDILRDIFEQANMLVWWARVRRENGRFLWRMRLPQHSSSSPLYKMAGALEVGGLWDMSRMPDAARMSATSEDAMLSGLSHYEQDFRALCSDGTHWIHEDVSIQKLGDNEWSLVAIAADVTARHRAEEAREESEFQIHQILRSADCLLWRAQVLATPPTTYWNMFVPPSVLYRRIFGYDPDNNSPLLWRNQEIPERAEIDARSTKALYEGWPGYEQEFRVIVRGTTFWLHEHVSITRKSETEWTLVGVIMDVTARRLAEQELAAEKERLAQALRQLQQAGLQPAGPTPAQNPGTPAPAAAPAPAVSQNPIQAQAPSPSAPTAPASETATPATPASTPAQPTRKTLPGPAYEPLKGRLLVMDDEEPIQRLAVRLIKRLGLEVEVCNDGNQVVQMYREALAAGKRYDIVMMDLNIPNAPGGREAIGPLLAMDPTVKAVVSSGASSDITPEQLAALGFVGAIPKPYDAATLHRSFKSILEKGFV